MPSKAPDEREIGLAGSGDSLDNGELSLVLEIALVCELTCRLRLWSEQVVVDVQA
jgi:hypothetical protein